MKTSMIVKSLLTSLCQREGKYPSLAKRGRGDFLKKCLLNYELISKSNVFLTKMVIN